MKEELKNSLKPLIKQCIKEVIFEEGVLSSIISEVVQGVSAQPIVEQQYVKVSSEEKNVKNDQLKEVRQKMLKAVTSDAYNGVNVFEGTEPLKAGGRANSAPSPSSPLGNYAPDDAGGNLLKMI